MEENKTDKYEYLNAPCLLENFKNTYLTSLNVFLNDDKFNQKVENLPQLKSSTIPKYEKLILSEKGGNRFDHRRYGTSEYQQEHLESSQYFFGS